MALGLIVLACLAVAFWAAIAEPATRGARQRREPGDRRGRPSACAGRRRRSGRCHPRRDSRRTGPRSPRHRPCRNSPADAGRRARCRLDWPRVSVMTLIADRHRRLARDDGPVLGPMLVALQREPPLRLHHDALHLEAGAFLKHKESAPGPSLGRSARAIGHRLSDSLSPADGGAPTYRTPPIRRPPPACRCAARRARPRARRDPSAAAAC